MMADEVSLNRGWSLEAWIAHSEAMRIEQSQRYQERFKAQEKATEIAIQSAKEAVLKAESATEKRFEGVNEFRAALADQSKNLISRNEVSAALSSLNEKVNANASRLDKYEGQKGGVDASWLKLVSVVGLAGTILAIVAVILKWG